MPAILTRRLLKTTFVAILALIAAELGLRIFLGMGTPPLSQADPDIAPFTRSPAPGTFLQSEPLGDSEQYRIQLISGSVTFGEVLTPHAQAISENVNLSKMHGLTKLGYGPVVLNQARMKAERNPILGTKYP